MTWINSDYSLPGYGKKVLVTNGLWVGIMSLEDDYEYGTNWSDFDSYEKTDNTFWCKIPPLPDNN